MKKRTNYVVRCKKTFPDVIVKGQYLGHDVNSKSLNNAILFYSIDDAEDALAYEMECKATREQSDVFFSWGAYEFFEFLPISISLVGDKK